MCNFLTGNCCLQPVKFYLKQSHRGNLLTLSKTNQYDANLDPIEFYPNKLHALPLKAEDFKPFTLKLTFRADRSFTAAKQQPGVTQNCQNGCVEIDLTKITTESRNEQPEELEKALAGEETAVTKTKQGKYLINLAGLQFDKEFAKKMKEIIKGRIEDLNRTNPSVKYEKKRVKVIEANDQWVIYIGPVTLKNAKKYFDTLKNNNYLETEFVPRLQGAKSAKIDLSDDEQQKLDSSRKITEVWTQFGKLYVDGRAPSVTK